MRENLSSIRGAKVNFVRFEGSFFLTWPYRQNASTEESLCALGQINTLNDDLVTLETDLADLRADLGVENGVFELKRLYDTIDSYGATIV